MDFGSIDLRENPKGFSFSPVSSLQLDRLIDAVAHALLDARVKSEEVLSYYTPTELAWDIPPLYGGEFYGAHLCTSQSGRLFGMQHVHDMFNSCVETICEKGMTDECRFTVTEWLGERSEHALGIADNGSGEAAACKFALEFVSMYASNAHSINLNYDIGTFNLRVRSRTIGDTLGVKGWKLGELSIDPADMYEHLTLPRGVFVDGQFDVADRISGWAMSNMHRFPDLDKLRWALAWIKLAQRPGYVGKLERALRKLDTFAKPKTATLKSKKYTDEALEGIRDLWVDKTHSRKQRLLNMRSTLVPAYIDDDEFSDYFCEIKKNLRVSDLLAVKITHGMERFIRMFQAVQRDIARGDDIGMT